MKLFLVVNVDWFFLSHRLPIALEALRRGYDVTVVAIDTGCGDKIRGYGLKFIPFPTDRKGINPYRELRSLRLLYRLYKEHKPDIVHHVALKPVMYGSLVAKGFKNIRFVNALSGMGYIFINPGKGSLLRKAVLKIFRVAFNNKRLRFIFQNNDDRTLILGLGVVEPKQCFLIPGSGVDLNEFCFTPEPFDDVIRILFTGRLLRDKGVIELVEAAAILKEKFGSKVKIILAGDVDENRASLTEEQVLAWQKQGSIEWIGFRTDVYSTLAASHIVVLPSYREGLPKSLIEACAVGRPIVTTDVPGCRDVVDEGINGFIVPERQSIPLAAALEKLVVDKELRLKMGKSGREKAERLFSIESVLRKTFEIYELQP
jgi:glycosyltransferase involved in cell wall biosynthesis